MSKIVLAAVDGSVRAPAVVAAARAWAEAFSGTVHLFRAVALPPDIPPAAATPPDPTAQLVQRHITAELRQLVADAPEVVLEEPVISAVAPWRLILAAAARLDAALIVIGSHGYGGWDHVLGTIAAQVSNRADRNVLVVHAPRDVGSRPLP